MDVLLIRHADAGPRGGDHNDRYRSLTERGHLHARELVEQLASFTIGRVLSSPAVRCCQTVTPVAEAHGLEVEEDDLLFEGNRIDEALGFLLRTSGDDTDAAVVACSHGDMIPSMVDSLGQLGVPVNGHGCEKGSVWVLSHDGTKFKAARRLK